MTRNRETSTPETVMRYPFSLFEKVYGTVAGSVSAPLREAQYSDLEKLLRTVYTRLGDEMVRNTLMGQYEQYRENWRISALASRNGASWRGFRITCSDEAFRSKSEFVITRDSRDPGLTVTYRLEEGQPDDGTDTPNDQRAEGFRSELTVEMTTADGGAIRATQYEENWRILPLMTDPE